MHRPMSTFFERLVIALDRDTAEKIARVEGQIDTSGMSRLDINYAIYKADDNRKGKNSESIRMAIVKFVRDVIE